MDVVVLSTVVAQAAKSLVEFVQARRPPQPAPAPANAGANASESYVHSSQVRSTITDSKKTADSSTEAPASGSGSASDSDSLERNTTVNANADADAQDPTNEVDEVAALEAKLAELQSKARTLTSPDAFVQYAQVTREANRIEKQLSELKAARRANAPPGTDTEAADAVDALADWLTSAAGGIGEQAARGAGRRTAVGGVISVLHTIFLWLFFRSGGLRSAIPFLSSSSAISSSSSVVARLPCDALRPISRLLASRVGLESCAADDWQCVSMSLSECTIGVAAATIIVSVAIRTLRAAFLQHDDGEGQGGDGWF